MKTRIRKVLLCGVIVFLMAIGGIAAIFMPNAISSKGANAETLIPILEVGVEDFTEPEIGALPDDEVSTIGATPFRNASVSSWEGARTKFTV